MKKIRIFNSWKKEDNDMALIKALWAFIGILVLLNFSLWIGWKSVPSEQRFYIPPDISHGATVSLGELPSATVYAFAYTIFSTINTWSHGGDKDYKKNLDSYKVYFSERFHDSLTKDAKARMASGGLSRERSMSVVPGEGYADDSVQQVGAGTWVVRLQVHIVETISGSVVKDVDVVYPIIVTQVSSPITVNAWGLVLSGYRGEPTRIKTRI